MMGDPSLVKQCCDCGRPGGTTGPAPSLQVFHGRLEWTALCSNCVALSDCDCWGDCPNCVAENEAWRALTLAQKMAMTRVQ